MAAVVAAAIDWANGALFACYVHQPGQLALLPAAAQDDIAET